MRIKPAELDSKGYRLLQQLEHKELIPFVKHNLKKPTPISIFFHSAVLMLLIASLISVYLNIEIKKALIADVIFHYCFGFTIAFLVIPVHEYIHVLVYRYLGAKETSLDYNIKKFYFLALANNFVVNRMEFTLVALAPFVVLNSSLIISLFFVESLWQITLLSALLLHTAMCSGDFGLLNFFYISRNKTLVTYDDTLNKISFFFIK
ncbi:MAG: DUF3267 domain-containing protein [Luteibaculaceae bacterium]